MDGSAVTVSKPSKVIYRRGIPELVFEDGVSPALAILIEEIRQKDGSRVNPPSRIIRAAATMAWRMDKEARG